MKKDNSVVDEKTFINADGIVFRSCFALRLFWRASRFCLLPSPLFSRP